MQISESTGVCAVSAGLGVGMEEGNWNLFLVSLCHDLQYCRWFVALRIIISKTQLFPYLNISVFGKRMKFLRDSYRKLKVV